MQITSMPAIRAYEYTKSGKYPIEIRMGTQTQRHEGSAEINPIFREWLKSLARNANQQPNASEIAHLYINNLPRDRDDFAGTKERILTEQLEKLEASQQNIAVVTMPADKGLLRHANLHSNRKDIDGHSAYMQIYNIATDNSEEKIKDFYISERVKKLIYGTEYGSYNKRVEGEIINQLLKNSFSKLGLDINAMLSKSEIAAVYFHFIKYELTNFIFDKLQPQTFNTSCKDGIDRGGASSAYFNLMKSIADGKPMSESEFHTALHAAPVLVKGRPMNEHVEHVWAAIHYALPGLKEKNPQLPRWLSEWDLRNTPQYASAHKHNMDWHVERLLRYIEDRSENADNNRLLKIETAKKLVTLLNKYEIQLEYEDTRALSDGELQKIFHGLVQDGFLSRKYLHKQNLMEYIIDRRGDPDRLRQQKVKTAEKLLRILDGSHEALDENDKIATSDGEMRDLFYALIDDGYFIDAKVEPSAPNYKPYL
jgi:hypothetical protein